MNTKIKIAAGVIAGLIAGAMLVGTAVAAPRMMNPNLGGRSMMSTIRTPSTFDRPTVAEMNSLMDQYRAADGPVDVNRMHADVLSGKVTPPCLGGTSSTRQSTRTQGGQTSLRRGPAMLQGLSSNNGSTGYTMMGSTY